MLLFPPWKLSEWRQVDDSVRGGASESFLTPLKPNTLLPKEHVACFAGDKNDDGSGVLFSGTLDIKALGGAGFASQRHTYAIPLNLRWALYSGIQLQVVSIDVPSESGTAGGGLASVPRSFTLTMSTTAAEKRPDGRTASRINWESEFELPAPSSGGGGMGRVGSMLVELPFESFVATYRGRPVEHDGQATEKGYDGDGDSLMEKGGKGDLRFRTDHIHEIGIMCRSGFGKQHGDFRLGLMKIEAVKRTGLIAWLVAFWVWLASVGSK